MVKKKAAAKKVVAAKKAATKKPVAKSKKTTSRATKAQVAQKYEQSGAPWWKRVPLPDGR